LLRWASRVRVSKGLALGAQECRGCLQEHPLQNINRELTNFKIIKNN
ncbi:MAG: hypothetical protein UR26_C0006G0064, partial [candidate division TM6 bacterium GW2011_GWF2_32_72]